MLVSCAVVLRVEVSCDIIVAMLWVNLGLIDFATNTIINTVCLYCSCSTCTHVNTCLYEFCFGFPHVHVHVHVYKSYSCHFCSYTNTTCNRLVSMTLPPTMYGTCTCTALHQRHATVKYIFKRFYKLIMFWKEILLK